MKFLRQWRIYGNDCEHCPCSWEDRGYEGECYDYGCFVRDIDQICRLPIAIRKLRLRRAKYMADRQYDDIDTRGEKGRKMEIAIKQAINTVLRDRYVCRKCKPGHYSEISKRMVVDELAQATRNVYDNAVACHRTPWQHWVKATRELINVPIEYIKSYVIGG